MLVVRNAEFTIQTEGQGFYEITNRVRRFINEMNVRNGLITVLIKHTGASLIIFENADESARTDLESFFKRLIPERSEYFTHTLEGPDDMPSHIRMVLTRTSETIPIDKGMLQLGTWQGIFIYEHRRRSVSRSIALGVIGEIA
ncbi:MAG: YjbQ family protein [Verrucomicrobia bacterium]|nr:YjbQ family protein [Verrucomicrobiota bacterium]